MNRAGVEAMKNPERYRHLRVDWVGQSSTQSITLCGVEGEDIGTGQTSAPTAPGRRGSERLWVGTGEPARVIRCAPGVRPFRDKSEDGGASRSGGADGYARPSES